MPELDLELWLRPEDVGKKDLEGIIAGPHEEKEIKTEQGLKKVQEIPIQLPTGEVKRWTMNKTSQRAIAGAYGLNSDTWKGKAITLFTAEQNVHGKMKDVIYARLPTEEQKKRAAVPTAEVKAA